MKWALALLPLLLLPLVSAQREYRVGVSPLVLDIGDVQKGEDRVISFYVISGGSDQLLVRLSANRGNPADFFNRAAYQHLLVNASEEDVSGWITFFDNPVLLTPTEDQSGGGPKGAVPVNFLLKVPEDADPGWHTVIITPEPTIPQSGGGTQLVAQVSLTLLFHVPGVAVRDISVLDVAKGPQGTGQQQIFVTVQNTGTVTVAPRARDISFFDGETKIANIASDTQYIRPGETAELNAFVNLQDLDRKGYEVEATVAHLTGFVVKKAPLSFRTAVIPPAQKPIEPPASQSFPWYLIIIIVIAITGLWYRRRTSSHF